MAHIKARTVLRADEWAADGIRSGPRNQRAQPPYTTLGFATNAIALGGVLGRVRGLVRASSRS